MERLKSSGLVLAMASLLFLATGAGAAPIKPNPGEGKYAFCKRMFDTCMEGVIGKPGSQSYNLGRAKCRRKWNSCRKTGEWPAIAAYSDAYTDDLDFRIDSEFEASED